MQSKDNNTETKVYLVLVGRAMRGQDDEKSSKQLRTELRGWREGEITQHGLLGSVWLWNHAVCDLWSSYVALVKMFDLKASMSSFYKLNFHHVLHIKWENVQITIAIAYWVYYKYSVLCWVIIHTLEGILSIVKHIMLIFCPF